MAPKLIVTYHVRSQETDGYGQHGYVGKGERIAAKINKEYMSGDFYPVGRLNDNGEVNP